MLLCVFVRPQFTLMAFPVVITMGGQSGVLVGCLLIGKNIGKQVHRGWRLEHLKALGSVEWVNLDPYSK